MKVDKEYCMSSFLMYRTLQETDCTFKDGVIPNLYEDIKNKIGVSTSNELADALQKVIDSNKNKKMALALSGGIDSAVLAKLVKKDTKTYTFKCIVPGVETVNEVEQAQKYAKENGLEHEIVEIYWEDFEEITPLLMKHKGAPIHSIEIQIYKAAKKAKEDGYDAIIFGESADLNYGGLSGLLSKDWTIGDFLERYSYVLPYKALKEFTMVTKPLLQYEKDGYFDVFEFCRGYFLREAMGSYTNACEVAGIELICPYVHTYLSASLDMKRIRNGQNKYIIRELFNTMYDNYKIPDKLPMPRATNEWFAKWEGPTRPEFWPHCTATMTGDQRWLIWCLERFLNMLDEE